MELCCYKRELGDHFPMLLTVLPNYFTDKPSCFQEGVTDESGFTSSVRGFMFSLSTHFMENVQEKILPYHEKAT